MVKYDAIVIGAGPNGLTAAAALAKRGKRVVVLEAADSIGGHTRAIEFAPGFRAPLNEDEGWVSPDVARLLGMRGQPGASINVGSSMSVYAGPYDTAPRMTIDSMTGPSLEFIGANRDAQSWPVFVDRLHKFAGILGRLYMLPAPDIDTRSLTELFPLAAIALRTRRLGRADMTEFLRVMPMSVQDLLDDTFDGELLKAAIAACAVRDLRQGPRSGGTVFNLIHRMIGAVPGHVSGRLRWNDGYSPFAATAESVALKSGAEIRTSSRVVHIVVRDHAISGVVLSNGDEITAPLLLSTADPKRTLLGLIDSEWLDPEFQLAVGNIRMRGHVAYLFFGFSNDVYTDDQSSPLAATVSLTPTTTTLERAADAAKYGEIAPEPHIEFFIASNRRKSMAPKGFQSMVARVQYAPFELKSGWTAADKSSLARKVIGAIDNVLPKFAASVQHSLVLSPRDIEERFGVTEGALTHGEMMLDQIMFMRPIPGWGRYAMPIRGLFLGGAGAHPGPGILGGAGYLAAKAALKQKAR